MRAQEVLKREIHALDQATAVLQRSASERRYKLAYINNRTASAAILVPELLEMIFMDGLELSVTPKAPLPLDLRDPSSYLLAISHTCHRWRNVALSFSMLWTRIHLEWPSYRRSLWLSRSKARSIEIVGHRLNYAGAIDLNRDVYLQVPRWYSIRLMNCYYDAVCRVLQSIKSGMRCLSLTAVDIRSCTSDRRVRGWHEGLPLGGEDSYRRDLSWSPPHFPALRYLTLWSSPAAYDMLSNVISLEIEHAGILHWEDWRTVLVEARHLEYLKVSYQEDLMGVPVPAALTMPHLHTVDMGLPNDNGFIMRWLMEVNAPCLTTMSMFIDWVPGDTVNDLLCDFVSSYQIT